jgi:hypothetical protein
MLRVTLASALFASATMLPQHATARDSGPFGDARRVCAQSMQSFPSARHGRQRPLRVAGPAGSVFRDKRSGELALIGFYFRPIGGCNWFGF